MDEHRTAERRRSNHELNGVAGMPVSPEIERVVDAREGSECDQGLVLLSSVSSSSIKCDCKLGVCDGNGIIGPVGPD